MDSKTISERLQQLATLHEQTLADLHKIEGAIDDCQYWLRQLETSNGEEETARDRE